MTVAFVYLAERQQLLEGEVCDEFSVLVRSALPPITPAPAEPKDLTLDGDRQCENGCPDYLDELAWKRTAKSRRFSWPRAQGPSEVVDKREVLTLRTAARVQCRGPLEHLLVPSLANSGTDDRLRLSREP